MAIGHDIAERIRSVALNLFLRRASVGRPIDYQQAETTAAQLIAAQERERKSTKPSTPVHRLPPAKQGEIGEHNAVELLIARISRLAERAWKERRQRVPFKPRIKKAPVVNEPIGRSVSADTDLPRSPPTPQPVTSDPELQAAFPLVISGGSTQLIDDSEYAPRWRESIATSNWRQSIETNLRIQREREERRRDRWIG
jgi:hypothetical protein